LPRAEINPSRRGFAYHGILIMHAGQQLKLTQVKARGSPHAHAYLDPTTTRESAERESRPSDRGVSKPHEPPSDQRVRGTAMFNSPIHYCSNCHAYVELDQSQHACALQHGCTIKTCPLRHLFNEVPMPEPRVNATPLKQRTAN
jgi:hypothetical protein